MISFSKFFKEHQLSQVVVLVLLLLLLLMGTVPGYLTGHWQWQAPSAVSTLKELRNIRFKGLSVPGWQTIQQQEQEISEHKWSWQQIQQIGSKNQAILLLLPQNGPRDQPQIEWTEIDGLWQWDIDQYRSAEFLVKRSQQSATSSNEAVKVKARFFRGATKQQTFSVLEWYALPTGGSPSTSKWFIADQLAQWRKKRVPWVAVAIVIPMEPLGELEKTWEKAKSIGEAVQLALLKNCL